MGADKSKLAQYPIEYAPGASIDGKIKVAVGGGGGFIGSWYACLSVVSETNPPLFYPSPPLFTFCTPPSTSIGAICVHRGNRERDGWMADTPPETQLLDSVG